MSWEGNGYPLQYSCLENSMESGAWQAPWGHKELDMTERLTHMDHCVVSTVRQWQCFLSACTACGTVPGRSQNASDSRKHRAVWCLQNVSSQYLGHECHGPPPWLWATPERPTSVSTAINLAFSRLLLDTQLNRKCSLGEYETTAIAKNSGNSFKKKKRWQNPYLRGM